MDNNRLALRIPKDEEMWPLDWPGYALVFGRGRNVPGLPYLAVYAWEPR